MQEARYRRGFVPAHAPMLGQTARPLPVGSRTCMQVAAALYAAAQRQLDAGEYGMVGLAAPQIGLAARAILFDPAEQPSPGTAPARDANRLQCVINPALIAVDAEMVRELEGCLSTGRVRGWVTRATRVRLCGHTPGGEPVNEEHHGLAALVLQHELDHLDGILFPDRVTHDAHLLWASATDHDGFLTYARATRRGEPAAWPLRTPRDQSKAIRHGLAVFGDLHPEPAPNIHISHYEHATENRC